jgi:uncharacterized protein (TIGR02588 family)
MSEETRDREPPGREGQGSPRSGVRTAAEWVTLGVSALILLGIIGYLVYQAMRPAPPHVRVEARALVGRVERAGDRYVLPIELRNRGRRTVRQLRVEVRHGRQGEEPETTELDVDYLGGGSTHEAYVYLEEDPRGLKVEVEPRQYQLE